jgi:transportin-3
VYEAIAFVISAMPMERAAESLRTFSLDILGQVHAIATQSKVATKQELLDVCGKLIIYMKVSGAAHNSQMDLKILK